MIRLITGLPGSGKSYFAVNEIIKLNYSFDKEFFRFIPKSDFTIFTNIENLKLSSINIDSYLRDKSLSIDDFFTVDFQRKLIDKYSRVVYLLDESQKYFPKRYYNNDVFFFFQYHRHLGIDIYLITQDVSLLPSAITSLVEYEIRAVRSSNRFMNIFRYHFISSGDIIGRKSLKADRLIFSLYTSAFSSSAISSNPRPLRKYVFAFVFFVFVVLFAFKLFISSFFPHKSSTKPVAVRPPAKAQQHKAVSVKRIKPVYTRDRSKSFLSRLAVPSANASIPSSIKPFSRYIASYTGGFWVGHYLKFICLDGRLYPVSNFPYRYVSDYSSLRVLVWLPKSYYKSSVHLASNSSSSDNSSSSTPSTVP